MAVKHGKPSKTFVKVFQFNIEDAEKEVNKWIVRNEEKYEIASIKFSSDCQSKVVVMVVCHRITEDKE